jgi:hypothetical protein
MANGHPRPFFVNGILRSDEISSIGTIALVASFIREIRSSLDCFIPEWFWQIKMENQRASETFRIRPQTPGRGPIDKEKDVSDDENQISDIAVVSRMISQPPSSFINVTKLYLDSFAPGQELQLYLIGEHCPLLTELKLSN